MSVILLKILIVVVMFANVGAMLFTMLMMTSGRNFLLLLLALILEFAAQFWLRGVYDRLPAGWG
ncbi:hypothetical protein [Erythrobacter sp. WG]|uniref:hypothetical protein n=1 Tax=Erythrobacter sp. WG TaxID=2985510 RepID=UPI00226FBE5A|nr:hypothetical protein [Erythrobacter sp. WG]MCX9147628.1 hypothetical protein [Erythrobacter sp. WG]